MLLFKCPWSSCICIISIIIEEYLETQQFWPKNSILDNVINDEDQSIIICHAMFSFVYLYCYVLCLCFNGCVSFCFDIVLQCALSQILDWLWSCDPSLQNVFFFVSFLFQCFCIFFVSESGCAHIRMLTVIFCFMICNIIPFKCV